MGVRTSGSAHAYDRSTRSRNFCQGEGGGPKKTLITFFRHQLCYRFTEGNQWFILRKTGSRGGPTFYRGGGPNVFRGGGAFTVKPIMMKDRFSHAMAHFSLLERLVTLQNMIRYMILDILSGSTLYIRTRTLYEISMR